MKVTVRQYLFFMLVFFSSFQLAYSAEKIPLDDFFKPSAFKNIIISPDGKRIAGIFEGEGMDQISILDLKTRKKTVTFDFGFQHRVSNLQWASNEYVVMDVAKSVGNLDKKGVWKGIYGVKYNGKKKGYILDRENSNGGRLIDGLPNDKKHIIVYTYSRGGLSIKKIQLGSKRQKALDGPAGSHKPGSQIAEIFLNSEKAPRAAIEYNQDGEQTLFYKPGPQKPWQPANLKTLKPDYVYKYMGHAANPEVLYFASNIDSSVTGLYEFNLSSGKLSLLIKPGKSDVENSIYDADHNLIGYWVSPDYPAIQWIDKSNPLVTTIRSLSQVFPGERVRITSFSKDHKKGIVHVSSDRNSGVFYLLNIPDMKVTYLASNRGWLKVDDMVAMKPFSFKARDGLSIPAYMSLPKGKEEAKGLPMVVVVHGGPHGPRDRWGFNPEVQFLANRGYAVLQVNYRGSGGYGADFQQAGYHQWGRAMQDDVTDATLWAVNEGIADPKRLCIYGGSYGGYAALMGVVREPDLYKCAIGYVGVYDLNLMKSCGDIASSHSGKNFLDRVLGSNKSELKEISPADNVTKIKANLFIAHGEDDVRVPMCQGKALKSALTKAGKPLIWMSRDEGHGYQLMKNRHDFYSQMESFFKENIGN